MATRTTVEVIDDFDFTEGADTRTFSFDGVDYEIDLNDKNYKTMTKDFARYVDSARRAKVKGRRKRTETRSDAPKAPTGSKEQNDAIREWAIKRGKKVATRGRIPRDIINEFNEEHSGVPAFSSA